MKNRELRTYAHLPVSIDILWKVWTVPDHLIHWWGPKGFTNTIHQWDFQNEGEWKMTMHGPDGTNYPNRSIFKEIIPHKKIVFEHFNPHFITTVSFENQGDSVLLDWSLLFDSEEMYEIIVKAHQADKGQQENIEKLTLYLAELQINQ
ncbi:SRPBCC domain-containing protein [Aquirufa nivalisilvae]|uniref:SRPBCC domain-containing protein n=1 Tax=Aquirufa nivalisilvae TaxID=2516557 RepID=UPI001032A634|nr:SRPBCC domain-containing protein [Aquirufa nivalisilvae]TBH73434.1 polyketide cyclase [Aquirufa nivalisilvae]